MSRLIFFSPKQLNRTVATVAYEDAAMMERKTQQANQLEFAQERDAIAIGSDFGAPICRADLAEAAGAPA